MEKTRQEKIMLELEQIIQTAIVDEELKLLATVFLHKNKSKFSNDAYTSIIYTRMAGFVYFINALSTAKKLYYLNWDFICSIYSNYEIYLDLKFYLDKLTTNNMLSRSIKYIDSNINKNINSGILDLYYFSIEFYKYIYNIKDYQCLPNIIEIEKYKHLFIDVSARYRYITNKEYTDFPIKSKYSNMITITVHNDNNDRKYSANFNINTNNKLIKNLMYDFLMENNDLVFSYIKPLRIFLAHFIEGFICKLPNSLKDFNDEVFKKQFDICRNLDSIYKLPRKGDSTTLFVFFYRFLIHKNISNYDDIGLSPQLCDAIEIKNFIKYYSKEYKFVYHNLFETMPISDRVCLLPTPQNMNNSSVKNSSAYFYDVTDYDVKYKEDIKKFVWNANGHLPTTIAYLPKLKEFFEIKQEFDKDLYDITSAYKLPTSEFTDEFLYFYRSIIELEYPNSNTLKSVLKIIRKYLQFFKSKYGVTKTHLDILNLRKLGEFGVGRVITDNDVDVIYSGFEKIENQSDIGRLYTIVFELFIHTNLRIGSILNLTRDCLVYNNDGTVTLNYLSKTSNQENIRQLITPTIVKIIEEALQITEPFIDTLKEDKLNNYIFVHKYQSQRRYRLKRLSFYTYFKKIIKCVSEKLDFDDYYPYNIRHTYMNNTFKNGAKLGLNLNEITAIAGISYKTANLYYRSSQDDIDLYVESLSKVVLNNVTIYGEIINVKNSNDTADINPVKEGLGNCKSNCCSIEDGECLRCDSFVTFTNRIPKFERAISDCDTKIKETNNPLIKEFYTSQKKLLAAYLSEMIKLNKKGGE